MNKRFGDETSGAADPAASSAARWGFLHEPVGSYPTCGRTGGWWPART